MRDVSASKVPADRHSEFNSGAALAFEQHPGKEVYPGSESKETPVVAGYDHDYIMEHSQ